MMRRLNFVLWSTGLALAAAGTGITSGAAEVGAGGDCSAFPCGNNGNKVLICHVPPGNPDNAHTICVNPLDAVNDHLTDHEGDFCGPCEPGGPVTYVGDINGDGFVGVADLLELVIAWGGCPSDDCPADLVPDGVVGVADFLVLLTNWD